MLTQCLEPASPRFLLPTPHADASEGTSREWLEVISGRMGALQNLVNELGDSLPDCRRRRARCKDQRQQSINTKLFPTENSEREWKGNRNADLEIRLPC